MITIDKSDKLYKYLSDLGVNDINELYIELAENGRYNRKDVLNYFHSIFNPSISKEFDDKELEQVVDYYADIKKCHPIRGADLNKLLTQYKEYPSAELKSLIINSQLKDLLHLCINYKSAHDHVDLQDLVQIANLGLLDALDKYRPNSKINFQDYIIYYVRNRVIKEFEEKKDA